MSFTVAAEAYDQFMGRYSKRLARPFADLAGVDTDRRVLDVGCGPGALLSELVARVGAELVAGVDPSEGFVAAARDRHPGTLVRQATAEQLPFEDHSFDVALAQLVVHFMSDPVAGLTEMARVTARGGVVAACVWDFHEGGSPLNTLWAAATELDPGAPGEAELPGTSRGHLGVLFQGAGLQNVEEATLTVEVQHPSFADWWEPFELGVGPAGAYVAGLEVTARRRLADRCHEMLGDGPFTIEAAAWAASGLVS